MHPKVKDTAEGWVYHVLRKRILESRCTMAKRNLSAKALAFAPSGIYCITH